MRLEAIDPVSGKSFFENASSLSNEDITELNNISSSDNNITKFIDTLNISADAKSLLHKLSKASLKTGSIVIKVGRKIVDIIIKIFKSFPEAGFGLILGAVLGTIVSSIPIIGIILGPIVTPIFTAFGLVIGLQQDLNNKALAREIVKAQQTFSSLKN